MSDQAITALLTFLNTVFVLIGVLYNHWHAERITKESHDKYKDQLDHAQAQILRLSRIVGMYKGGIENRDTSRDS